MIRVATGVPQVSEGENRASVLPQSVIWCTARTGRRALKENLMLLRCFWILLASCTGLGIAAGPARAHPHVWVTTQSEILFAPDGSVTGVRHAWTFDDMFSVFATQGIESKNSISSRMPRQTEKRLNSTTRPRVTISNMIPSSRC